MLGYNTHNNMLNLIYQAVDENIKEKPLVKMLILMISNLTTSTKIHQKCQSLSSFSVK